MASVAMVLPDEFTFVLSLAIAAAQYGEKAGPPVRRIIRKVVPKLGATDIYAILASIPDDAPDQEWGLLKEELRRLVEITDVQSEESGT